VAKITTYPSGKVIQLLSPKPEQIQLVDIAQALSNICRYTGQCPFYSVAEHSILVARALQNAGCDLVVVQQGLMHDAAEAYLGDVTSPLKARLLKYRKIESRMRKTIFRKFNIPVDIPQIVWDYDHKLLHTEYFCLKGKKFPKYEDVPVAPNIRIIGRKPGAAMKLFLNFACRLGIS
jgi:hypothetical protein